VSGPSDGPPPPALDDLRRELAEVDRRLVELVGRRLHLASSVGAAKRAVGRSTRDFGQERDVVERARANAATHGVPPRLAEDLALMLIRSALTVQERETVAATGTGGGRRVLVIGGAGKMGRWFAHFLASQGYLVEIADPVGPVEGFAHRAGWADGPIDHDVIVVAAQLRASNEILHALAARTPPGLVFDLGSLKSPLRTGLLALVQAGVRVTSIHPMFGPDTELLSGRHVVFVDVGVPAATAEARALFGSTMAVQTELGLESHDRLIAYILGLSHAVNIAFFTAVAESGETARLLRDLSSTTFQAQLDVATRVAAENPHLYFEIQSLNDYGTESLSALLYAVERLRSVVRAGDERGFAALMTRGKDYLDRRTSER
jgi:chorismate mutase/prephenate dehydrogenase